MKEKLKFIRIDPLSAVVRVYQIPIDDKKPLNEMTDTYYKTLILNFFDNGLVRISACLKSLTFVEKEELQKKLAEMGYKKIIWKHHQKEFCLVL